MKPLSRSAKLVLDRYRESESMSPARRDEALQALEARIAAGGWPALPQHEIPEPPILKHGVLSKLLAAPMAKVGLGVVLLGAPVAWFLAEQKDSNHLPASARVAEANTATLKIRPLEPASHRGDGARAELETDSVEEVGEEPARVIGAGRSRISDATQASQHARLRRSASKSPTDERGVSEARAQRSASAAIDAVHFVDEEVALLRAARLALQAGRPGEALDKLAEHSRRFPSSKLADSREASRVFALCASGKAARARERAAYFLKNWPNSPMSEGVKTSCAETR